MDDQDSEAQIFAQQAAAAALEAQKRDEEARRKAAEEEERAALAEREARENLRAKMAILNSDDEEPVEDFFKDLAAEEPLDDDPDFGTFAEPVRTGPPQAPNSLFDRPEMNGKKIKVMSAASKRNGESTTTTTTTTIIAPVSTFTSVNRRPQAIDLSDSESDDEVPASAPPPKKTVGRPRMVPTRGGMVPTRGGGTPKRGRGRPRKST